MYEDSTKHIVVLHMQQSELQRAKSQRTVSAGVPHMALSNTPPALEVLRQRWQMACIDFGPQTESPPKRTEWNKQRNKNRSHKASPEYGALEVQILPPMDLTRAEEKVGTVCP